MSIRLKLKEVDRSKLLSDIGALAAGVVPKPFNVISLLDKLKAALL
jgi:hypothetical protein